MIKILITSVGSLVGQNILDALEFRRNNIKVIGMNSVAENQRNFRCDSVYLAPPTDQAVPFEKAFEKIFQDEQPDMVFAGRDSDVVFLSRYKEAHPEIGNRIPCGHAWIAQAAFDKYESYRFAIKHNLPFADTFLFKNGSDEAALKKFIEKHGFPLIIKPRHGFGSLNVFFLTDLEQLQALIEKDEELLVQEYLCPDKNFEKYLADYKKGMPLFFQVPENNIYISQCIISPDQKVLGIFTARYILVGGKVESTVIYQDDAVDSLMSQYVGALTSAGWKGFINIQYKPDRNGRWKVFEINLRMGGATSSRLLMGFDELGLLINAFYPEFHFPVITSSNHGEGMVLKYLRDHFLEACDVAKLKENKFWQKH